MASLRQALADGFAATGLSRALLAVQAVAWRPHVRAVNYHDVPPQLADRFEEQLHFFADHFESVGLEELRSLHTGHWPYSRPGLIISFDDGLRSHRDVAAPLLEKHGFCGWFMVPTDFVEVAPANQRQWARTHSIQFRDDGFDDERIALTWDDVRALDRSHVIVCHSRSHRRLSAALTAAELRDEIPTSKRTLEERLGHEVAAFAWVGGEEQSYSATAARAIRDAGFEFGFMTNNAVIRPHTDPLQLQRSHVEASFPMSFVRLTLSGFYDLMYWPKRRRVNRLTAAGANARRR